MKFKNTISIGIEHLFPHPGNPRKDLGDLTELADSIKKNGLMQNLTVMPKEGDKGNFTILIGHRRCAAARLAGVKMVPCRIVEGLSEREQMSIMLEENMQRNDLTIWEQANGFQMMLDLGETEASIAEKTGFSRPTIKHRLEIAKLDSKTLKAKEQEEGFQLSLMDLYQLEKIKDVKKRNKILEKAESSNALAFAAIREQRKEKAQETLQILTDKLKEHGIQKAPEGAERELYTDKWETILSFDLDSDVKKFEIPEKTEGVFYLERYGWLYLIRKAKKQKKEKTAWDLRQEKLRKNRKQIKEIMRQAADKRSLFIKHIISGDIKGPKDTAEIERELFDQIIGWYSLVGENTLVSFFSGKESWKITKEDRADTAEAIKNSSMLEKMMCIVEVYARAADLMMSDGRYNADTGKKVHAFYFVLEKYGYKMSDEEREVVCGTSDLYERREDDAKK